jgi:ubiquinone/menaquinone biosynthesis C-methylase UbiE
MLRRFVPGTIDYNGLMAANYQQGRALSPQAAEAWRAALAPFVPQGKDLTILDLGAGTGRFAGFLSQVFAGRVIGVEPAFGMRSNASPAALPNDLTFIGGSAEQIPLRDASCDVAWLSQVLHHVRDRTRCAGELRRVLRGDGRVFIRGALADSRHLFPTTLRFFPGIAPIFDDLPSIAETVSTFQSQGFMLEAHRRVEQQISASLREFADRTRLRADTSLALLSDEDFEAGMAALDAAAAHETALAPIFETLELLVFRTD